MLYPQDQNLNLSESIKSPAQRAIGHCARTLADDHGPPAHHPVQGEQRERHAERPDQVSAARAQAGNDRRMAGHEPVDGRPELQDRDDQQQRRERRACGAPDLSRRRDCP
jgi:hypothetical protein